MEKLLQSEQFPPALTAMLPAPLTELPGKPFGV